MDHACSEHCATGSSEMASPGQNTLDTTVELPLACSLQSNDQQGIGTKP